jgi:predicted nucleotidyltransferase
VNNEMLSELFGGADRYSALRCLFSEPEHAFGARELAARAGIDPGNASRWLRRWSACGLIERLYERGIPRYRASTDPQLVFLQRFLQQGSQWVEALRSQLRELDDRVDAAAVFGSAASGKLQGDSDIDLLLLTSMSRLEAQTAFKAIGRRIGRAVNVLAYRPAQWEHALELNNPLALEIANGPLIVLKGDLHAAAQA